MAVARDSQTGRTSAAHAKPWLGVVGLALLGAGCIDAPPEPLHEADLLHHRAQLTLDDPAYLELCRTREIAPPAAAEVRELSLPQATLAALCFRPEIAIARAHVEQARGRVETASTLSNPNLSVTPNWVTNTDATPWVVTVAADVLFPTAGKRSKAIAVAEQETLLAELDAAQQTWQLLAGVRDAWTEASLAQQELRLAQEELQARRAVADFARGRLERGAASRGEVATAELELAHAQTQESHARAVASLARVALAAACGVPLAEVAAPAVLPAADATAAPPFADTLVLDRLDVRRAVADYEAAERTLRLELARQYPDVHLLPGFEYDQGAHKYLLGVGMDLPLFDRNQGAIAQAIAHRKGAAAEVERVQSQAIGEYARARDGLASARAAAAAAAAELARANDVVANAERAVARGASDRGELAAARLVTIAAEHERLSVERALRRAQADVEDARQRPLDPTLAAWAEVKPPAAGAVQ